MPDRAPAGSGVAVAGPERSDRVAAYLMLATLLRHPPTHNILAQIAALRGDASPLGMAQMALADAARTASAESAGLEHFSILIGIARGEVVPYASFYLTGFLNDRPLAELRADMQRLGIARNDQVFEPEDHIGSLLEIMAGLLRGDFDNGSFEAETEADRFFERHIAPVGTRILDDIAAAPSARFYRAVATWGSIWLALEQDAMRLPP
jgi:TorA maturation chaperone TorD